MTDTHAQTSRRPSGSTRTIEEWYGIFTDLPRGAPANAVNCAYRLLGDLVGWSERGGHKDTDADQIASAMLAFKRIGSDNVHPIKPVDVDYDGQTIYVESEWVIKFVEYLIGQSLKYRLVHEKDEKAKIILSGSFNLREELPTHLRGKFSMSP